MTHPRTAIRNAFVDRLKDATAAEDRVHAGRLMPIEEPQLPAIVVHTRETEKVIERSPSGWNGFEERRCIVSVVCVAQDFDDIDTALDTMAAQVEAALQSWTIPGFESSDPSLEDTDMADPEFEGSLATSALTLRYAVVYRTPYRTGPDPYVQEDPESIYRSGAYPGGQVTPDGQTGEACPIGSAEIFSQEEPIN
jgi:hypothetical protein